MNEPAPVVHNLFVAPDGRLRSPWRFIISVLLVLVANFLAGTAAYMLSAGHARLVDVIFRPLLTLLELGGFFVLTEAFDRPSLSPWQYNGLPRANWLQETLVGA